MKAIIQTTRNGGLHVELDKDGADALGGAFAAFGAVVLKVLNAPILLARPAVEPGRRYARVVVDPKGVAHGPRRQQAR